MTSLVKNYAHEVIFVEEKEGKVRETIMGALVSLIPYEHEFITAKLPVELKGRELSPKLKISLVNLRDFPTLKNVENSPLDVTSLPSVLPPADIDNPRWLANPSQENGIAFFRQQVYFGCKEVETNKKIHELHTFLTKVRHKGLHVKLRSREGAIGITELVLVPVKFKTPLITPPNYGYYFIGHVVMLGTETRTYLDRVLDASGFQSTAAIPPPVRPRPPDHAPTRSTQPANNSRSIFVPLDNKNPYLQSVVSSRRRPVNPEVMPSFKAILEDEIFPVETERPKRQVRFNPKEEIHTFEVEDPLTPEITPNYLDNAGAEDDDDDVEVPAFKRPRVVDTVFNPSAKPSVQPQEIDLHDQLSAAAANHYNQLRRSRDTRHQSQIYHMRNLNNFTKVELIDLAAELLKLNPMFQRGNRGVRVLELACGKGGDMAKWVKNPLGLDSYVGSDIAESSLEDFAGDRLMSQSIELRRKVSRLITADLGKDSLCSTPLRTHKFTNNGESREWTTEIPLSPKEQFDCISCQFALHYMFKSRQTADHFFSEVSRHLTPGGVFIATTIDCRVLSSYLMSAMFGPDRSNGRSSKEVETSVSGLHGETDTNAHGDHLQRIVISNELEHRLLSISFDSKNRGRFLNESPEHGDDPNDDGYGIQYNFQLHDSGEEAAVDAPEFIVPLGAKLDELAASHGLCVKRTQNFHHFITSRLGNPTTEKRLSDMKVLNFKGTISDAEWAIARLYTIIVLEKPIDKQTESNATGEQMTGNTSRMNTLIDRWTDGFTLPNAPDIPRTIPLPDVSPEYLAELTPFIPSTPPGPPPMESFDDEEFFAYYYSQKPPTPPGSPNPFDPHSSEMR